MAINMKGPQPTVPVLGQPFSNVKATQVIDAEKIRRLATASKLNDVLAKLALGRKK